MILLPAAVAAASFAAADPPPKFGLKDGDRIVWIGNTLVEREQRYGYWETALHAAYPKTNFTLRNLGWSGDTVFGDARAGFDTPAKGFERLVGLTLELKPTVIFVSYGQNESFDGEAGLPRFEKGLDKLLDALKPANARVVLFTPLRLRGSPPAHIEAMKRYADVVRRAGQARRLLTPDVGAVIEGHHSRLKTLPPSISENGIHLTEDGYRITDQDLITALGLTPEDEDAAWFDFNRLRTVDQEPLRQAVVAKNELFFHRWRPQNETYLFGFRKHEQGKNAKEVAEFDPLVKQAEDEIERIKKTLAK